MTRWPVVLAAGGLVAAGWWIGVTVHRRGCEERYVRLYRHLLAAEANQDHALCRVTEQTMANYIAYQEARLDVLQPASLEEIEAVAEAERITREGP